MSLRIAFPLAVFALTFFILPTIGHGNGPAAPAASSNSSAPAALGKGAKRQREGLRLNELAGTFEEVGDGQFTFTPEGTKESYRTLENLALERVANVMADSGTGQTWLVSGQLTEFRGSNYLLIARAVIRNSPNTAQPVSTPKPLPAPGR